MKKNLSKKVKGKNVKKYKKVDESLKPDISKFITQLLEKNYSNAGSTLESLIEKKLKNRIKKMHKKCECEKKEKSKNAVSEECGCNESKNVMSEEAGMPSDIKDIYNEEPSDVSGDESSDQTPQPEDIVLSSSGPLGTRVNVSEFEGKYLGTFANEVKAFEYIKKYMEQNSFYPDVWWNDDHGGFSKMEIA